MSLPVLAEPIMAIEKAMQEMPQAWHHTDHHFAGGIYARVLHVPANTVFTGALHRTEFFVMIASGRVMLVDTNGTRAEIVGPYLAVSPAGTKRAFHVLEDAVFVNFHRVDSTDPDAIIAEITAETFEDI